MTCFLLSILVKFSSLIFILIPVLPYKSPNEEDPVLDEKVRKLLEMFPASCQLEAFHCLSLAGGDMDEATQLILDRQESGESIVPSAEKV